MELGDLAAFAAMLSTSRCPRHIPPLLCLLPWHRHPPAIGLPLLQGFTKFLKEHAKVPFELPKKKKGKKKGKKSEEGEVRGREGLASRKGVDQGVPRHAFFF